MHPAPPGTSRRFWRPALALLLSGILVSSPLRADPCANLPKPSLKLQRIDEAITHDNGESYRSLSRLGARRLQPGSEIIGLTRGNAVVEVETRLALVLDRRTNLECATPQVTVSFGYRPMTVHVAREFPPGTCAHDRILEHEMRHVQVYRDHLGRVEPEIARMLQQRLDTWTTERRPAGLSSTLLRREIHDQWIPQIRQVIARVEEEQARVDSDEEYRRVTGSCQGAIRERLRAAR